MRSRVDLLPLFNCLLKHAVCSREQPLDGQFNFKEFSGLIVVAVKKVSVGSESLTKDVYCSDLSRGIALQKV